nr:prepilin-type N-terminal cleavage/methylation domain-containing protein [Armatimonas sp.]
MKTRQKLSVRKPQKSFTLIEVAIASALMGLIFTASMMLFLNASRNVSKLRSGLTAARAAGRVQQFLSLELTEAYGVVLPNDTVASGGITWNTALGSTSNYKSTNTANESGWAGEVNTALYMLSPQAGTASVQNGSGTTVALSGSTLPVDRGVTTVTNTALIFRGNPNGTANPAYGTCLWLWRYTSGTRTEMRLLTDEISTAWNAVSFVRTANSRRSVILKIVCGDGVYPSGEQTSDSMDGQTKVSLISGRTVYMANSALYTSISIPYPADTNLIPQPNNATPVPTAVPTASPSPTAVPTATPVPTVSPVPTASPTPKPATPTPTPSPTPKPATPTPTPTPKPTPVPIG